MKNLLPLILLTLLLLTGCATTPMSVIMTNPQTGKSVYITHHSWGFGLRGLAAMATAQTAQRQAIEAARRMGYTKMDEVK